MRRPPSSAMRGFTLVELVVATTLTALLMLVLGAGLFAFGRASAGIDAGLERIEALRLVPAFLRTALGGVADSAHFEGQAWRAAGFRGGPESIEWIGTLPGRHGPGGLHHLRLAAEDRAGERVLVLRLRPFHGPGTIVDWGAAAAHPVLGRVERFAVAYKAPAPDIWNRDPHWLDTWPHTDQLPEAVRFTITIADAPWPPLVVPLLTLPAEPDDLDPLEDVPA